MRDYRCDIEKNMAELCEQLIVEIWNLPWGPRKMMDFMGRLRDIKAALKNKEHGCPSGLHGSECLCEEGFYITIAGLKKRDSSRPPLSRGIE